MSVTGPGCCEASIEVRIVDPKRVRSFALSAGRLAKNDAIDAEMIAWFAETFREAPSQTHDAAHEELQTLVKARLGLIEFRIRLASQSEHAAPGLIQKAHAHILKSLAREIAKLEAAISAKVKSTPNFAERAEIIESVPGFAETSSANLVAGMPELGQVSDKIAAALIGVAPYDDDSGKRRGERHIKGGRRWVRNAIYMPCVGAATLNLLSTPACQRKTAEGRPHRLHAQTNCHPQHHDRTTAEMGSRPLRAELTERIPHARSPTERVQSRQTSERTGSRPQPPKAGARQRQP
jgi:transposase